MSQSQKKFLISECFFLHLMLKLSEIFISHFSSYIYMIVCNYSVLRENFTMKKNRCDASF
ncbi:unnamed protein product [Brassica rapa subsp. trilocularis]